MTFSVTAKLKCFVERRRI